MLSASFSGNKVAGMLQLIAILVLVTASGSIGAHGSNQTAFKANHQHVRSHGHKNFETSVRTYDRDLFHASLNLIDTLKVEIKGFYHVSTTVGHWNEVLEEHLMLMDGKRFSTNLFASKIAEDRMNKKKHDIGMKLSTGWSSVLEIADSIELNFDAAADPAVPEKGPNGAPQESAAYRNLTTMLSSLHLRGGAEKIHVKPYSAASTILPPWKEPTGKSSIGSLLRTSKPAAPTEAERRELVTVLGEVNSVNELHAYCKTRRAAQKDSFVFLMHNQETNCTSHFMKHIAVEVRSLYPLPRSKTVTLHLVYCTMVSQRESNIALFALCCITTRHTSYQTNCP
jgi:hypothetical protein